MDDICPACNGSGEGMHDGTLCRSCGGTGTDCHEAREKYRDEKAEFEFEVKRGEGFYDN